MSNLVRNEVPITGDIPGAGTAGDEGLTLGKIRDWLTFLPTLQFSIFRVKHTEDCSNTNASQRSLQKFGKRVGGSVFAPEIY